MLTTLRFRSVSLRDLRIVAICAWVTSLIAIGGVFARAACADDSPPAIRAQSEGVPGPVAEEADIFRQRSQAQARAQRKAAKSNKEKKAPPTVTKFFSMKTTDPSEVTDGWGTIGRGSHLIGKTFGRNDSITPLEFMPYILTDEHFLFADVRGFASNRSRLGGNAGLGYRYLREDFNAWAGASIWYDADDTSSKLFQQLGLSFETLVDRFEWRSNAYLPITSTQTFSNSVVNERIVGNQLLFGRSVNQGTALRGIDTEIGYSLPVRDRHRLRGFVGGYHFEGGSGGGVNGFKARVEGVINNGITAQVLYTHDRLYGDNVMVGCSLQLPFGNNHPTSGWKQSTPSPFRFVERNYNVIVSHHQTTAGDQIALNPLTNQPYKIQQVEESGYPYSPDQAIPALVVAPTGDGTTDHPFNYLASAQAAGGDVFYIRSGSIFNHAVTLSAGQHLIGESAYSSPTLAIAGGGVVHLPNLSQTAQQGRPTLTPRFEGVNGTAVTLASNTEVAGFNFNHTTLNGVAGTNVSGISLHDLTFDSIGGDAIHLTGSSGNVTMSNIQVNSASGNGIVLDGGNAIITYSGLGNTITAQGDGIVLANTTGGAIDLANVSVKETGGAGLRLANVGTDVTLTSLNASETTGPAVAISGTTGTVTTSGGTTTTNYNTYNFTGFTTIASPKGAGFTVNGSDAKINVNNLNVTSTAASPAVSLVNATSEILVANMSVGTTNATGLYARGLGLLQVNGGSITAINAPAIDIQGSTINTKFGSVSANGGPFGISLVQSTGIFTIQGNGNFGTGGTIQNTNKGLIVQSFGTANLAWIDFTNNGVGVQSAKANQLSLSAVRITGSTGYAIDSLNDTVLSLSNSILNTNGALGGGTIRVQADTLGTYQSQIASNTITDVNGTAIQYQTLPSGAGASLAATILSNSIGGSHGSSINGVGGRSAVLSMNWNGPASVRVSNNTFNALGSAMTGAIIQDTSATGSLAAQIDGNTFSFAQSQGTGLSVIANGTSSLTVASNTFGFNGTGGIGTRFALNSTSTDFIAANIITDGAGGATGMLFDHVAANSRLQIEGNTINFLSTDLSLHQGFVFTAIDPTIQFSGTTNNLIFNTSSPISIPVNASTGGFLINGTRVP